MLTCRNGVYFGCLDGECGRPVEELLSVPFCISEHSTTITRPVVYSGVTVEFEGDLIGDDEEKAAIKTVISRGLKLELLLDDKAEVVVISLGVGSQRRLLSRLRRLQLPGVVVAQLYVDIPESEEELEQARDSIDDLAAGIGTDSLVGHMNSVLQTLLSGVEVRKVSVDLPRMIDRSFEVEGPPPPPPEEPPLNPLWFFVGGAFTLVICGIGVGVAKHRTNSKVVDDNPY
jgi:hypothetical protein